MLNVGMKLVNFELVNLEKKMLEPNIVCIDVI